MKIKIEDIAELVNGTVYGNNNLEIENLAKIEDAKSGELTFLYLSSFEKYFNTSKASAIIVKTGFNKVRNDLTYVEVDRPDKAFFNVLRTFFSPSLNLTGIDSTAQINANANVAEDASIGKNVVISAGCKIGRGTKIFHNTTLMDNVVVGNNCLIHSNVSIRENSVIGDNVIIHSGSVIGSDGFGYEVDSNNCYQKIPQIGNVVIEDDVEIGSNVSIDRAALGSTIIKKGCKIDNLVQIAHNVILGEHTVISAQAGISGSTKIGDHCILAGQAGLVGHIELGSNVVITAQSGVSKSILKPGYYMGSPAREIKTAQKIGAHLHSLPSYAEKISELEKEIQLLKSQLNNNESKKS